MWNLPATPKAKSYKVLKALVGGEVDVDDEIELATYKGKKFKIFIVDGNDDDDGNPWQNVNLVKAVVAKKKA